MLTLSLFLWHHSFGRSAAHGGVDPKLTSVDDLTYERMTIRREGAIGPACERETKGQTEAYVGPYDEAIKSSVSTNQLVTLPLQ